MARPIDAYRTAIVAATCDQLIEAMELQAKDVSRRRGSWMTRALGIQDAVRIVKKYKELATRDNPDLEKVSESTASS